MSEKSQLTQDQLKRCVSYDPNTGVFTRLARVSWNAKAGDRCGCIASNGYRYISIMDKKHLASRLAFLYMSGAFPAALVDHISGDTSDDSWGNLREVSHSENLRNCKLSKNNKSGHLGVHRIKRRGQWRAEIMIDGRNVCLGYFDKLSDAVMAREKASSANGYHPNHGRSAARALVRMRLLDALDAF